MGKASQAIETLVAEIKTFVQEYLKTASFDVTKQGLVTASLGNNKYSVKIEGAVYTVPSCTTDTYSVNDNVLVVYIQNDSKRKYIYGRAVA